MILKKIELFFFDVAVDVQLGITTAHLQTFRKHYWKHESLDHMTHNTNIVYLLTKHKILSFLNYLIILIYLFSSSFVHEYANTLYLRLPHLIHTYTEISFSQKFVK